VLKKEVVGRQWETPISIEGFIKTKEMGKVFCLERETFFFEKTFQHWEQGREDHPQKVKTFGHRLVYKETRGPCIKKNSIEEFGGEVKDFQRGGHCPWGHLCLYRE